ncbi:MAG TPA: transcriptional regulator [Microbacteriaceae bacterium]|nr:transcriptional regulator [Microbacteriaceae bacterium]
MDELDPVIHVQARLRIVSVLDALEPGDSLAFTRLQDLLGTTSGNLATHLRRLEEADYVRIAKTIEGRSPATFVALTETGRLAFAGYKRALAALLA